MVKIEKRVCDRCGKETAYSGWTVKIFCLLHNGNPDEYRYSNCSYELCSECTQKLKKFLRNEI